MNEFVNPKDPEDPIALALALARSLGRVVDEAKSIIQIAIKLAKIGRRSEALVLIAESRAAAERVSETADLIELKSSLALALLLCHAEGEGLGLLRHCTELALTIPSPAIQGGALLSIAIVAEETERFPMTIELLERVSGPTVRQCFLTSLAYHHIHENRLQRAYEISRLIQSRSARLKMFSQIALRCLDTPLTTAEKQTILSSLRQTVE